jgi:hypothetical protein
MSSPRPSCPMPPGVIRALPPLGSTKVGQPLDAGVGVGGRRWRNEMLRAASAIRRSFRAPRILRSSISSAPRNAAYRFVARVIPIRQRMVWPLGGGLPSNLRHVEPSASVLPTCRVKGQPGLWTTDALVDVVCSLRLHALEGSSARVSGFCPGGDLASLPDGAGVGAHCSGPLGLGRYFTRGPPLASRTQESKVPVATRSIRPISYC